MSSEWTVPEDGKIPICPIRLMDLMAHLGDGTQKELASRMGVGLRALTNYLKGEGISLKECLKVMKHLGITEPKELDSRYRESHTNLSILLGPVSSLPLSLPSTEWDPSLMPPGALLRADLSVVEFHMRERELKELENWCIGRERLLVQLCHGPGGMGKTRLAIELCRRMKEFKWRAGFLKRDQIQQDAELWRKALELNQPLLLVLDYAEHRADTIRWLVEQVVAVKGARVRLLLLARKPGEWLENLKSHAPGRDIFTGPAFSKRSLSPVSVAKEDRRKSWDIANRDLAKALRVSPVARPPENLDADHLQRVLLLQMTVLAGLDGVQVEDEDGLLDYVLRRERSFWARQLRVHNLPETLLPGLGQAMAAVTAYMGAETEADGMHIFRGLPFFSGQPEATLHALNQILADCYPGAKWIEPVQPDLLGERLIDVSTDDPVLKETIFGLFEAR
ncbi:MAG: helix-turn-helix domain-containing protein [Planctomycetaceae bacterium]